MVAPLQWIIKKSVFRTRTKAVSSAFCVQNTLDFIKQFFNLSVCCKLLRSYNGFARL